MLSSRTNPNNGGDDYDDIDDDEGESTMPGDYEPWRRAASRISPSRPGPPPRPIVPSMSRPSRRLPIVPSTAAPTTRRPITPATSSIRSRRPRRRSLTPEIVIERRHHHHHHHPSSDRHRVIRIPLDSRPTLGLRGPPKRVLEIERVRCHRRRKHRSSCYEIDYDPPPPPPMQPQSNVIIANPLPNPCLSSVNNSAAALTFFSNLTPEIIENLPKQTIHLPPIHLPGSQADANTELDTVIFPAEIINPIDGTLSIIQPNSTANVGETANIQSSVLVPAQPQLISAPTNDESPLAMLAMTSGPFMQQVNDLFQRITLSQPQPTSSPFNHAVIQPSLPVMTQYNAATNSFYNPQSIPSINTLNAGSYPPANIQPTIIPNSGAYNPTTFTPSSSANTTRYRPANIIPYQPTSTTPYRPANITPYQPTGPASLGPANITPYQSAGTTSYRPANITPYQSAGPTSYRPANITPYQPGGTTSYRPANITPYQPSSITSYNSTNTTPYRPTTFTPSNLTNTRSYYPPSIAPPNASDTGPYRPANITPYGAGPNRSGGNSLLPSSIPFTSIPFNSSSSLVSSDSFSSSPSGIGNRPVNIPHSSQTISQTPYQSNAPMPRSILRNPLSNAPLNTTFTRLNPPNVSSTNSIVRETPTVA